LVRVTPTPNNREQNAWSVPRSLGRCSATAPIVGLDRHRWLVAVAAARPVAVAATLIARPAQELLDLGLQGDLEHQPHAESGNLFKDRRKVMIGAEQLVDLGADALDRRYSSCHGCRSSLVLGGSREPTPVARLHQGPDATCDAR
jgi:hypothetical protein